jgi:hypothetical protein
MRAVPIVQLALLVLATIIGWYTYSHLFIMHLHLWVVPLLAAGSANAQIFVPAAVEQAAQQALSTFSK